MIDFEARQIIEALRSGVSSQVTSQYFSSARPKLIADTEYAMHKIISEQSSSGMIVSGKYGEGKTHFLNTVFNMAGQNNMVVSHISLSKETPFDKLFLVYQKLLGNTYLPGHMQPGVSKMLESLTLGSPIVADLLDFCENKLETNKLYYLIKSFLGTEDQEEKYMLLADLEGDFINNVTLKQIYKRIFNEQAVYNISFSKTKHCMDYFAFMSYLFLKSGYSGWVILFDESELIGRLGKKARINAYSNMASFLFYSDNSHMKSVYSAFALTASFVEDVIDSKHEFENLENVILPVHTIENAKKTLELISTLPQLTPLNNDEILCVLQKIMEFHSRAYNWRPDIDINLLFNSTDKKGHLLRTRIRAAVEFLDQLYQYGDCSDVYVQELAKESYEENLPSLEELV